MRTQKMNTVCNKNFDVFDFKDESPGVVGRIQSKLEKNRSAALDKYTFLATAAAGENMSAEKLKYAPTLGIDAINITHMAATLIEDPSSGKVVDSDDSFTVFEQPQPQPQPQSTPKLRTDLSESEVVNMTTTSAASPSHTKLNPVIQDLSPSLPEFVASDDLSSRSKSHLRSSQKENDVVEMDPDEKESLCEGSLSPSEVAEDDGVVAGPSSDHCIAGWEMDSEDIAAVVFYPDYIMYHDSYYTDSIISFSSSSIKMEASTTDGDGRIFKCKWGIEDIHRIKSYWHEQVEMAMVVVYVLNKDTILSENVECTSVTELKFAVIGSQWHGRLEAIASLNATYKLIWTSVLESEDNVLGHTVEPFSKYLPNFSQPFEEVVYPKGEADAVSISKRDFDLLEPDTFVNDTIIDFYIKYLKNKIEPEERHRFHFFNSFFFRKLADPDKDPIDASRGRAAFQRVKKWTRKLNLFEKDYVFIPVNYNYHWSLIVICHLGDMATYKDEDVNKSLRVPCVLHMDSIRGSHTGLKGLLQSYLKEEWKERNQGASEDICSRFDNLRFISLELPQQQNSFDCGLFLLHYVELFLEEAPLHFNPFKITKSFNFLNVDWFPPADASLKRTVIQKLICDLLENPHQESSSIAGNQEQCRHLSSPTQVHKDDPCTASKSLFECRQFPDFNQTTIDETPIQILLKQEGVEGGGGGGHTETESAIQQDTEIMADVSALLTQDFVMKNLFELSAASACEEDSVEIEIVDVHDSEEKKRDYTQMMMLQASENLIDMQQNTTKKMCVTQEP